MMLSEMMSGSTPIRLRRPILLGASVAATILMWLLLARLVARGALTECGGYVCPGCPMWPLCLRAVIVLGTLTLLGPVLVRIAALEILLDAKSFAAKRLAGGGITMPSSSVSVEVLPLKKRARPVVEFRAGRRVYRVAGNFAGYDELLMLIERAARPQGPSQ